MLPAVRVIGQMDQDTRTTSSATHTDTPVREIPQSVSVITQQVLENAGDNTIQAAMDLSGVGRINNFAGSLTSYSMRGFAATDYYRNGMLQNTGFGSGGMPDIIGIQSLDVLRGPSSLMFGQGSPGGTMNIVSKQPQAQASQVFGIETDSEGARRGTIDLTGPLNTSGSLLYRLSGALENSDTFRDHVNVKRQYFAPSLHWQITPATRLKLDIDYLRQKAPFDRGIIQSSTLRYGLPDIGKFYGEPAAGNFDNKSATTQMRLEHDLSQNWSLELGAQYTTGSRVGNTIDFVALQPDLRTISRTAFSRDHDWHSSLAQAFINGQFELAGMTHRVLAGLEVRKGFFSLHHWKAVRGSDPLLQDVYEPEYGAMLPTFADNRHENTRTRNHAFLVQDQVRIAPRLSVLAGLRLDRYRSDVTNRLNGKTVSTDATAVTPRLGLNYDITDTDTVYLSYSRSFTPNSGLNAQGENFDPERGTAYELGVKSDFFNRRLQVTTSVFNIVKTNVLTTDPARNEFSIAAGEVRSRGLDISLSGRILPHTRLTGYAAWLDAEVTKDNTLGEGSPLENIPRRQLALMLMHEFNGRLSGLEAGASVRYASERFSSSSASAIRMAPITTFNLMAGYQFNRNVKINIAIKNVFDRKYVDYAFNDYGYPGAPRTFQISLQITP